jgi:Ca-activated chloride channel family protein
VDASNSLTPQFRQEMIQVVELMAQTRGVPDDSFSVVSFQDLKPRLVCERNCRALGADAKLLAVQSGGLTPLYDSIVFTSRVLAGHEDLHARKVLILFSDGMDTISQKSFTDALDSAVDHDIAVYSVDTSKKTHLSQGTSILRSLCSNTGGRYFSMEVGTEQIVDAILRDFRATYTVAYKLPTQTVGFHQVQILPTHDLGLQFHCRRGYYYPANPEN